MPDSADPSLYGISRMEKYEKTRSGWFIRIRGNNGKFAFSRMIADNDFGGKEKALEFALQLRDKVLIRLHKQGLRSSPNPERLRSLMTGHRRNRSGVVGIVRHTTGWGVGYKVAPKQYRSKTIHDRDYNGSPYESFRAALIFRQQAELDMWGYSNIDPFRDLAKFQEAMLYVRKR